MKKILIVLILFLLVSCSTSNPSYISTSETNSISTESNDVGGDHLQSDWEW